MALASSSIRDAKEIVVERWCEWGRYLRIKSHTQVNNTGEPVMVWKREAGQAEPMPLPLVEARIERSSHKAHPGGSARPDAPNQSRWVVTIFLVNQQETQNVGVGWGAS